MRFLNKFSMLFIVLALAVSSCTKEEPVISEDELREQSLEILKSELENISDQSTDELEKGTCARAYGLHDSFEKRPVNGQMRFRFNTSFGDLNRFNNKWFYLHVDVSDASTGNRWRNQMSKMFHTANGKHNWQFYRAGNFSSVYARSYIYVWTGSSWCRLDVIYQ